MKASLFYLPTIASRAEIERGMAGMNGEFYQRMLRELSEQIRLADDVHAACFHRGQHARRLIGG